MDDGFQLKYKSVRYRDGNIFRIWKNVLKNIRENRFLLKEMVKATLIAQFKRSLLGMSWLIITPVLTIVAWLILHSSGIFNPGDTGIPYPAYVLLSTAIWTFFVSFYKMISDSLLSSGRLFVQLKFPHEILILEKVIVAIFNFIIPLIVTLIVLVVFGVKFHWQMILFPFALIPLVLLGISLGMIFSLLKVVAVDLNNFFDHVVILLMYITPIVYSPRIESGLLQDLMYWNPLTYLVSVPREMLINGTFFAPLKFIYCSIAVLLFFIIAVRYFIVSEKKVIERLTI